MINVIECVYPILLCKLSPLMEKMTLVPKTRVIATVIVNIVSAVLLSRCTKIYLIYKYKNVVLQKK